MTPHSACLWAAALAVALSLGAHARGADAPRLRLQVDATDIARRLVHARLEVPAPPGDLALRYVEWTPGNHNPSGPIQNIIDLRVTDRLGRALQWDRDIAAPGRIIVRNVPNGSESVMVEFSYIADQPSVNSRSTDTYGEPNFGALNWNTVLFYPEGARKSELMVEASLEIPRGWTQAGSLGAAKRTPGRIDFAPVTLAALVDSPVIFGERLRTFDVSTEESELHFIDGVAREESLLALPDDYVAKTRAMIDQAAAVFGPFPWSQFHFLVLVSDATPSFGVEHAECTLVGVAEKDFKEAGPDTPITTLPHEYVHAWNGKLRAPAGLTAPDYHTPAVTDLLWVYEGLTSYYDDVLAVRSGVVDGEWHRHNLAGAIARYEMQPGRRWRSVVDTARGLRHLRERSGSWEESRRRQDYYGEGALFWMTADAIIRAGTGGAKSLDDFCLAFFDVQPIGVGLPVEYTRADVVAGLSAVYSGQDWDALIREMIESPRAEGPFDLPQRLGYRLEFADEPTELQKKDEKKNKGVNLLTSLGLSVDEKGAITAILRGSPADSAGMAYDMTIIGVGDEVFTPERLREAVKRTPETVEVRLLVKFGEKLVNKTVTYNGGLRYPRLVREEGKADLIEAILMAR